MYSMATLHGSGAPVALSPIEQILPTRSRRALPLPVSLESFSTAFGNVRRLLTTAKEAQDPKELIIKAFQAIEASAEIAERIVMSVGAIEDKVETWELAAPRSHSQKPCLKANASAISRALDQTG